MTHTPDIPYLHSLSPVLADATDKDIIPVRLTDAAGFEDIHSRASASFSRQMEQADFTGKDRQICILRDEAGRVVEILAAFSLPLSLYAFSTLFEKLRNDFSSDFLKSVCFRLESKLSAPDATQAAIGWALGSYKFTLFKKDKGKEGQPVLLWPENADKTRAQAMVESLCIIKTLINLPANVLGTNELADAAAFIAREGRGAFSRIVDQDLIAQNFPMIYDVGKASPNRPQLIEILWGDENNPPVTLVGKGVVFDTGGLDLKPPPFMALMKKDMGGAAHVLGLAHAIMRLNLPVRLRVLISAAENSVGGASFRPGDILKSRKGLSVEIGDTDAEGRLVVADALTYACEGPRFPELLVDFCTLTGSARAALGYDIPAFFSNREELQEDLRKASAKNEDPLWPLPLWQPYLKEMQSSVADINNIGTGKAGAIHGALFLQQFIDSKVPWIHIDCYAWEQSGKPGRPAGGADTGMRAMLAMIENHYAQGQSS
jgi:leucyl aminopeptidase